jgi:hypothetical protein
MDPDQPAHPRGLIRIYAVRLQSLLQVEKLIANSMDPDQTADCAVAQAGLDSCWSQTHYVGFVMTRLNYVSLHNYMQLYFIFFNYIKLYVSTVLNINYAYKAYSKIVKQHRISYSSVQVFKNCSV